MKKRKLITELEVAIGKKIIVRRKLQVSLS